MSGAATDDLAGRAHACFDVVDHARSAIGDDGLLDRPSRDRLRAWRSFWGAGGTDAERLLPTISRRIHRSWPTALRPQAVATPALRARVAELGPWKVSVPVARGLSTMDGIAGGMSRRALLFRRELVVGTLVELLGDDLRAMSALDLGCQAGFFSLDLATRGAAQVTGVDLRPSNLAQASFLAEHFGVANVDFAQVDAEDHVTDERWDVVLNLGLLYHVTRPLEVLRRTYEMCRSVAVIDTLCAPEPFSAFVLVGERDTDKTDEGRGELELHPTYRGVIDAIRAVGFSEVLEVTGRADPPYDKYDSGDRRCFLAFV